MNLEIKEDFIVRGRKITCSLQPCSEVLVEPEQLHSQLGFLMTGRFTEDKRASIERGLRHLKSLLIDSEVIYGEDSGTVVVTGQFTEDNEAHIKMTISYLEKLFTSCKVTW